MAYDSAGENQFEDEQSVAKERLLQKELREKIVWQCGGLQRVVDVTMALRALHWPALVLVEICFADNEKLRQIPFHWVWNVIEKIGF